MFVMSEQSRPHAMGRLPGQAAISHTAPHHLHGGSTLKLCRDAARVTSVTICQATGIPTTMQIKICMTSVRRGDSRGNNRIVKNTSKKKRKTSQNDGHNRRKFGTDKFPTNMEKWTSYRKNRRSEEQRPGSPLYYICFLFLSFSDTSAIALCAALLVNIIRT